MNHLEGTIFEKYDSVYFDLDKTIWECFSAKGTSIGAYSMNPPFELASGVLVKDIDGNYCRLQDGIRTVLKLLNDQDMNMGIISSGEKENTVPLAQPSVLLLKKFNLWDYFNLGVLCKQGINKRNYIKGFGKTLFIDDNDEHIQEVKMNEDIDVLNRSAFDGWDQLLQSPKTNLSFGISMFLTKLAAEEFQYNSSADTLLNIYKAEQIYSYVKNKRQMGDDISDSENIRYLKVKSELPGLFEDAIRFLQEMLQDTLEWENTHDSRDDEQSPLREGDAPHSKMKNDFMEALLMLIQASANIYNEDRWPDVFIAIDNVINLAHMDFPYIEHMISQETLKIENATEDYVKNNKMPKVDAEDFTRDQIDKLEERWNNFIEYLTRSGKALKFTAAHLPKVAWQIIPEGQNPNLTPQYNLIKKAIERLDMLDFGGQDLVQNAFYDAKETFEKIGNNYNLKNLCRYGFT